MSRRQQLIAALLLVLALALRVGEVQRAPYKPINDASAYLFMASAVAHTGGYAGRGAAAAGTRGATAYWPPGYPYFLAAVDLLDGHTTWKGASVHPAQISQAVLGTIIVALIGAIALELFGPVPALIAIAIAAVYPVLIELSAILVAENLLTLLALAATWCALRAQRTTKPYGWIVAAGVLTGLATLTHMNGVLLLIPLGVAAWRARRRPVAAMVLVAVAILTVLPWTIRNAVELHRFIPVSDETGITLVGTYNPASAANTIVPYKWRLFSGIPQDRRLLRQVHRLTEPQLGGELQSQALRYIGEHPLAPIEVAYHNTLRMFELEGSFAWEASAKAQALPRATARIGVVSFWILCLLAVGGLFTRSVRHAPWWLWAVPLLIALSVILVNVETPRFREPIDPFLILLAACGVEALAGRALRGAPIRRRRRVAVAAGQRELVEMRERLA